MSSSHDPHDESPTMPSDLERKRLELDLSIENGDGYKFGPYTLLYRRDLKLINHSEATSPLDIHGLARGLVSMLRQPKEHEEESEALEANLPHDLFSMPPGELVKWAKHNCSWILTSDLIREAKTARVDSSIPVGMLEMKPYYPQPLLASYPPQQLRLDPQSVRGSLLGTWSEYLVTLSNQDQGGAPSCALVVAKWIDAGLVAADQMFPGLDRLTGPFSMTLRRVVRCEWSTMEPEAIERMGAAWADDVKTATDRPLINRRTPMRRDAKTNFITRIVEECFFIPQLIFSVGHWQYCLTCDPCNQDGDIEYFTNLRPRDHGLGPNDKGPVDHAHESVQAMIQYHFANLQWDLDIPDTLVDICECNVPYWELYFTMGRMPLRLCLTADVKCGKSQQYGWWNENISFRYSFYAEGHAATGASNYDDPRSLNVGTWTGKVEVMVLEESGRWWAWLKKAGQWFRYDPRREGGKVSPVAETELGEDLAHYTIQWTIVKDINASCDSVRGELVV